MASLNKQRARKPLVDNCRLTMVASSEGANGFTLWINDNDGADYAFNLSLAEASRFASFVCEMAERRAKAADKVVL